MKMNVIIYMLMAICSLSCQSEPSSSKQKSAEITPKKKATTPEKSISSDEIEKALNSSKPKVEGQSNQAVNIKPKPEKKKIVVEKKEVKKAVKKPTSKLAVKPKEKVIQKPAAPPKTIVEKPKVFFPDTLHNYGFINEGDTIKHSFRFINDGKEDLEILDVQVSCGCTIPVYSLEPIKPGRLSKIDITFLSKGKVGSQLATIDILTNASNPRQTLYLKGVIR